MAEKWFVDGSAFRDNDADFIGIYTDKSQEQIVCEVKAEDVGRERCEEYAALIAAAPALLAACKAALDNLNEVPGHERQWACEELEAAIAKAAV